MSWASYASALVLSLVLAVAAFSKLSRGGLSRDGEVVDSFRQLRVPMPRLLGVVIPLLELVVAMTLIVVPRVGGVMALVMLMAFTAVLVRTIRSGTTAGCGCFGRPGSGPVRWADVWRNAFLALLALMALATATPPGW